LSERTSHEQVLLDNSFSSAEGVVNLSPTELIARASAGFSMSLRKGVADRSTSHANVDYSRCLQKAEPKYLKNLNLLSFPLLAVPGIACYYWRPPHSYSQSLRAQHRSWALS